MSEEKIIKNGVSRREFLKDASLFVGGTAVGSMAILSSCSKTTTETVPGVTAPAVTVTVTQPPVTKITEVAPAGSLTLNINGKDYPLIGIKDNWSLAYVIREKLGLTGTKRGCDTGDCGVCSLIMEGRPVLSCMVLACEAAGKPILTIESMAKADNILHPIQQAFVNFDALQCGWCTPGAVMTTKALLDVNPKATEADIREALAGCLCRCGTYQNVRKAVLSLTK